MVPIECQDAFNRLMRYFAWLVEEYGFALIECKTGTMGYCGFTLRSGSCLLYMDVERGCLQFGSLAFASTIDQGELAVRKAKWYSVGDILDYLRGYYPSWAEIEAQNKWLFSVSEDERMTRLANECRTIWPRVMELFQESEYKRRHMDLKEFLERKEQDLQTQFLKTIRREESGS